MITDYIKGSVKAYRRALSKKLFYYALLTVVLIVISLYSLSISKLGISFSEVLDAIWNHVTGMVPDRNTQYIDWWIDRNVVANGARTVCGICVGAILAACGAVMQTITRNPLTDPYTIGVSSAALMGVTVSVIMGVAVVPGLSGDSVKIVNAFVFAMIPSFVILFLASMKRLSSTMMVLVGIAMMYMFNAFTTFLKYNAESEQLDEIYRWSLGTLTKTDWDSAYALIPVTIATLVILMIFANSLNVLGTGDNVAKGLGVNPSRVRIGSFVLISAVTSVAVCYTGTIGFVGLVAPHISRLFVGSDNKLLVPLSMLIGGIMVVGADILVRWIPQDLPVGVITAVIGSPLFLFFLYKQRMKSAF